MNRERALAIGRAVQQHPFGGISLADRIATELLKAFDAGAEFERVSALSEVAWSPLTGESDERRSEETTSRNIEATVARPGVQGKERTGPREWTQGRSTANAPD